LLTLPAIPGLSRQFKNGGNKMSQTDDYAVFDAAAAATFTGLAVATLAKLRCIGGGPEYLKLGRKVVYRRSDLANWLNARRVANTTQAAISLPPRLTNACSKAARSAEK
jgi:Helix-turn-helix domain